MKWRKIAYTEPQPRADTLRQSSAVSRVRARFAKANPEDQMETAATRAKKIRLEMIVWLFWSTSIPLASASMATEMNNIEKTMVLNT
jgi:hypothetical protein